MKESFHAFKLKLILFLILTFLIMGTLLTFFSAKLRPSIVKITQSYAKNEILHVIDDEARKVILEEFLSYEKIVDISRDAEGKVTSVSANAAMINKFTNDLSTQIGNRLEKEAGKARKIPLSNILGIDLFAGLGPKIPIRYLPLSVTNADVSHAFEGAGINQTLHTINLTVRVEVEIVLPLAHSSVTVKSKMPIAQTLIVGSVPEGFLRD